MCSSWYLPRFLFKGVIDTYAHGLLYGSGDGLGLPIHYGEAVQFDGMTCGVGMVTDGEGGSKVFPVSVPKSPTSFTNILHCASWMVTLVSIDDISLVDDNVPILGDHQQILNCVVTLEMDLDSCFNTYIFAAFAKSS